MSIDANPLPDVLAPLVGGLKNLTFALLPAIASVKGVNGAFSLLTDRSASLTASIAATSAAIVALGAAALPGGFEILGQVVTYLAAVIGSVATPIFLVMMGSVMVLADMFRGPLLTATREVATWLANNLQPAIEGVVRGFLTFSDYMTVTANTIRMVFLAAAGGILTIVQGVMRAVEWVLGKIPGMGSAGKAVGKGADELGTWIDGIKEAIRSESKEADEALKRIADRQKEGRGQGQAGAAAQNFMGSLAGKIEQILKTASFAMAQKANVGFTGIADVAKQVQMQAFQSDIQTQILKVLRENLGVGKKFLKELQKVARAAPAVGA